MRFDGVRLACLMVLALILPDAFAQTLPSALQPGLAALSPAQRAQLQQRQAWLDGLSPAQRRAFAQRVAAWDALPAPQRAIRRQAWAAWQALAPHERPQLQAAAAAYAMLPLEQQQALRRQFDALDASEQRGWLLGPALGVDYPRLQPLLAQVPANEHAQLRKTLVAMSPGERDDLAVLVQRTPPQERDALRRALVSASAANRAAWLQAQLDR